MVAPTFPSVGMRQTSRTKRNIEKAAEEPNSSAAVLSLFDFQASAFRKTLFQLGQGQAKDAVHILGFDLIGIHAGDVKASDVIRGGTLQ